MSGPFKLILIIAALIVISAPALCAEAEAPAGGDESAAAAAGQTGFEYSAKNIRIVEKGKAVILSGSAWLAAEGMMLEAENIVAFPAKRQAYASGAVRLTDSGGRLLTEEIFYDFGVHRGRAKNVRLELGKVEDVAAARAGAGAGMVGEGTGSISESDLETEWSAAFGEESPHKWYLSAPEIRRVGPGKWVLVRPAVSSCSFHDPHWRLRCSSANYLPGRRVESFNNVLFLGPVPVFYLPYIARDLAHDYPWTTWQFGDSTDWGPYVLSKWGFDLPSGEGWIIEPRNIYFDLDWRRDRGMAYGADLSYEALPHGGGYVDTYYLREDDIKADEDQERAIDEVERRRLVYDSLRTHGAPKVLGDPKRRYQQNLLFAERRRRDGTSVPDLFPDLYADQARWRAAVTHRQDFFPVRSDFHEDPVYKLDLTVEYSDHSDRDMQREYFRDEFRHGPAPVSYAMLRQQTDVYSAAVVAQPRVDDFLDQTEYLPELRFSIPSRPLSAGFFLASEGSVGYLQRRFDEDSGFIDFEAGRAQMRLMSSRPFNLGSVAFRPYVGTDQAWYSDGRDEGGVARGALLYGADSSVRFYGNYQAESDALDIHGLRHVIEPRLFYRGVSDPTHDIADLYDFDQADDLFETNVVGAGLYQKLQVRRASGRTVDLLGLDFTARGLVDRDEADLINDGDRLLPFKAKALANPTDYLRLWGSAEIDAHGVGVDRTTQGLRLAVGPRLAVTATHSTIARDPDRSIGGSSHLNGRLDIQLAANWRASVSSSYELRDPSDEEEVLRQKGLESARFALIRDLHCWQAGVSYSTERRDDDVNRVFSFTLSPQGRPRNLVKASDALISDDPDYSRLPWVARPGEAAGELHLVPPEKPPQAEPEPEGETEPAP